MLVALLLAASDPDGLLRKASNRIAVSDPAPIRVASPYRLDASANTNPTAKDRAIASDGRYCNVVGARMCTGRPRPLLRAELTQ